MRLAIAAFAASVLLEVPTAAMSDTLVDLYLVPPAGPAIRLNPLPYAAFKNCESDRTATYTNIASTTPNPPYGPAIPVLFCIQTNHNSGNKWLARLPPLAFMPEAATAQRLGPALVPSVNVAKLPDLLKR
jgi:hypothetical protein